MKKTADSDILRGRNLIGARLRRIRLAQVPVVSLEDMAGRMAARGVLLDRSAIGRIENCKRYVLDYELKALADALHIRVAELID